MSQKHLSVPFPAVALLQKHGWSQQANLFLGAEEDEKAEGFLGYYNPSGPECTEERVRNGDQCVCSKYWNTTITEDFPLDDGNYSALGFRPKLWFQLANGRYLLLLKVPFKCKYDQRHTKMRVEVNPCCRQHRRCAR